jgi:hypothetical protein
MALNTKLNFYSIVSVSDCECKRRYKQIETFTNFATTLENLYDRLEEENELSIAG